MKRSLILLIALAVSSSALAQGDLIFVRVENVPGDLTGDRAGWMQALALEQASECIYTMTESASVPFECDPELGKVSILKAVDGASVGLRQRAMTGSSAGTTTIEVCRAANPQDCYYKIEMTSSFVDSVALAETSCGDPSSCPPTTSESVTFIPGRRVTWSWTVGGNTGSACWDQLIFTDCGVTGLPPAGP